ncbi:WO male-killing family protein Wmk [Wolbachia endosymbiont of Dactylopius coccus]
MSRQSGSLDYKVGQKVKRWRLERGYTQEDLANKIGITRQVMLQYEKGTRRISIEKLYAITEALSVSITDLIPIRVSKSCLEGERGEILNLARNYKKINDQELRKIFYLLTKSAQLSEKSSRKAERVEIAKNLVKAGISVDIVSKTIGLSANECIKEKTGSIYYKIGKKIKEWRLVREYTQKDLAEKMSTTRDEISNYEQGRTAVPLDKLYGIAEVLSVNIKVLLPETRESKEENKLLSLIKALLPKITKCENEDSKKLLSLMDEYREDENQEPLDALVKSLSEDMKSSKEKVKKAEKIKVAKDLVKAGIAIEIIVRASGLTVDELSECPKMN